MNLFDCKPDPLDGFDAFWALFPKDPRRKGKKSGPDKCKDIWKVRKLYKVKSQVLKALKEDIEDIKKGSYAIGEDRMKWFNGPRPWLNQKKYDRDIVEPPQIQEVPPSPEPEHIRMPQEEFLKRKEEFRRLANWKGLKNELS